MDSAVRQAARKYGAFVKTGMQQELGHPSLLFARVVFFFVVLIIFSSLWPAVFKAGLQIDATPGQMLWYLFITESIALSLPRMHEEAEQDMTTGNIACGLTRPAYYPGTLIAKGFGLFLVRVFFFAALAGICTALFGQGWPAVPARLVWLILLVPLAGLLLIIFEVAIGISALWLQESTPLYWVWQKILFIFGGLLLPVTLYPPWMQKVAACTPFYPALFGSGRLAFREFDSAATVTGLLLMLVWIVIAALFLRWLFTKALRQVTVNGG